MGVIYYYKIWIYITNKCGKKLFISYSNMDIRYLSVIFNICHITIKCRTEMQLNYDTTIKTQNYRTSNILYKQYNFCV